MGFIQVDPQSIKLDSQSQGISPSTVLAGAPPPVPPIDNGPKQPDDNKNGFVEVDPNNIKLDGPAQTGTAEDIGRSLASGVVHGLPTAIDVPAAALATGIEKLTGSQGTMADLFRKNLSNGINPVVSKATGPEYQPQTEAGKLAKGAGAAIGTLPIGGEGAFAEGIPMALTRAATAGVGGTAAGQAGGAIGQQVGGDTGRKVGQVIGNVAGAYLGSKLPGAPSAIANAVTPQVSSDVAPLAARAQDLGVPLSVNQVAPSKAINTMQKASQPLPFSGVSDFENTQRTAFNQAVAKTLGSDVKDLTPDSISSFVQRNGSDFDRILKDKPVTVNANDLAGAEDIATQAGKYLDASLAKVVQNSVDELKSNIGPNGVIDGSKLASFRSQLIKGSQNAQGGAKEYLGDLATEVDNIAQKGLSPEDAKALGQVRREYRNYKTIEPLLEKATDGQINPTELNAKIASSKFINAATTPTGQDALVDLGRIGKQFLPKLGGSDTYDKVAIAGGTGVLAGNPLTMVPTGLGLSANRALQGLNRNQSIVKGLINKGLKSAPNPSGKPSAVEVIAGNAPTISRSALRDAPDPSSKPMRIDIIRKRAGK